jgi:predicted dehydrogenase
MRIRFAVVGAGLMGGWHARYAARFAELAAIVDRRAEAAALLRQRFPGAAPFGDLDECLKSGSVDVVHVCTDLADHGSLIGTALQAGKHVLCEKPVARSARELEPLVALARERGLTLAVVHQLPWQRGFRRLRSDLARLGDLVRVEYAVCSAGGDGRAPEERFDILTEMLPHPYSLLRGVLGEAFRAESLDLVAHDSDSLWLSGRGQGPHADVFMSLRGRPTRHELIVTGSRATAWLDLFHGFGFREATPSTRAGKLLRPFARSARLLACASANLVRRTLRWEPAYPGLLDLIRHFYRAVEARDPLLAGLDEMRESLLLMEKVRAAC